MALKSNRAEVSRKLRETVDQRLEQSGIILDNSQKTEIVRFGAVDTGRMLSGVTHEKDGNTVRSGPTASYSPYVALGTRYVEARNFVLSGGNVARPALIALWKAPVNE